MRMFQAIRQGLGAVWDIGVTPELRPEEAKHVRQLNIGMALFGLINLLWFFQGLFDKSVGLIIPLAQISISVLCVVFFVLHRVGRYTAARMYSFILFYAMGVIVYTLSGPAVEDHYFFFVGIACTFLIFPRRQKKLMVFTAALGLVGYVAVMVLYHYVPPAIKAVPSALELQNQLALYNMLALFIVLMLAARYAMDKAEDALGEEREKLAEMAALLKKMFGRYLSTEVMNSIIDDPSSLELGGERRRVTIMMTDLRGFTALAERLAPERVVAMLNAYFEIMVDVVLKYQGTINEFIGDALLVIFGAPQPLPDRTARAVACAIDMQNAMARVNADNRAQGLPELEMGIGLNEAEVVVGNIGSSKRSKYTVVGSGVNLASRIESYTVGGQVLVSESVKQVLGDSLRIDGQREVLPKGATTPLRIFEVGGIAGQYNLVLAETDLDLVDLTRQIPLTGQVLDGKDVGRTGLAGRVIRLSRKSAEVVLDQPIEAMVNLKLNLTEVEDDLGGKDFYAKVVQRREDDILLIRFTALPPEVSAYFQSHRQHTG